MRIAVLGLYNSGSSAIAQMIWAVLHGGNWMMKEILTGITGNHEISSQSWLPG